MLRSKLSVAAGIVTGVIVAGTIAWAAIPAADGTITACYRQRATLTEPKGALRVVDSPSQCTSGETALTWNQQGQPGPAGPAGISGARFVPTSFAMLPDSGDFVQIATTTLPRGSYVVIATVTGSEVVNDENTLICHLRHGDYFIGGQTTGLAEAYQDIIQHEADYASLTVTGGAALDDGDAISLWCRAEGHDAEVQVHQGHIMILQVGGFM